MPWMIPAAIIGSSLLGADSASSAAATQADAANRASGLSNEQYQQTRADQLAQYQQTRADQAPYREAGVNALGNLQRMANNVPGAFNYSGNAPGAFSFSNDAMYRDPGYQFRLSEGQRAMAHSNGAGRGGLVSGNSLKAMQDYAQNSASGEYSNAYNRAFNNYNTGVASENQMYNRALTGYNTGVASENQMYNRQAALSGIGQTATNLVNAAGANTANYIGNAAANNAASMGNYLTGGAAAQAAGTVGVANAANSGLGTYLNYTSNNNLLNALKNRNITQNPNQWELG